jgi:gamma-glutamyltranspeptidase/glutathione hydrolase
LLKTPKKKVFVFLSLFLLFIFTINVDSSIGSAAIRGKNGMVVTSEEIATKVGVDILKRGGNAVIAFKRNEIEPGKRMLSSMSPTIIIKDGNFFMSVGAMGGPKIITATLQTILNVIDFDQSLQEAIDAPRIHHQWQPDRLFYERLRIPVEVIKNLSKMQHDVHDMDYDSEVTAILKDDLENVYIGAADFRWHGVALGN